METRNSLLDDLVVVIPTRNRVNDLLITIRKCLDIGILEEQIMVTDDASTDGTGEEVSTAFPGVILRLNKEALGPLRNRNDMMRSCTRKYIVSLDDDSNILRHEDLEEAITLLSSKGEYGIFGFNPIEQLEEPTGKECFKNDIYLSRTFIASGCIIKRSVIDKVTGYNEVLIIYGEEQDLSVRCFKLGIYVVKKRNLIYHHRIDSKERDKLHKSNASKGQYSSHWRAELYMTNKLLLILMYYPGILIPSFLSWTLAMCIYIYFMKNRWQSSYLNACRNVVKKRAYIKKARSPLTLKSFFAYMNLEY